MLSKFPNKTLKVGAIVSLSPQSRYRTEAGFYPEANPVGIAGVVTGIDRDNIYVKWPTFPMGNSMYPGVDYKLDDYDLIAEGEPGFLEI